MMTKMEPPTRRSPLNMVHGDGELQDTTNTKPVLYDNLLSEIAQGFESDEKTDPVVS